ncbi:hypothetical protein [Clostridium taeniosporum]|uniref:Uncharacterized protein n=1 Tax=Clostridium taeniosporum TaxID=394958 RepID=A0A1D7XLQ8_9CLOT|nr:hypothetical protein [Clostridium taeniosporum]AOR24285.1 hypothetical protein BGI42_11305 [Clostridium taeniosporum]
MGNLRPPKRKKQNIKVRVHYPTTPEGIEELKASQAKVMLTILEESLGPEGLDYVMEELKKKISYK